MGLAVTLAPGVVSHDLRCVFAALASGLAADKGEDGRVLARSFPVSPGVMAEISHLARFLCMHQFLGVTGAGLVARQVQCITQAYWMRRCRGTIGIGLFVGI